MRVNSSVVRPIVAAVVACAIWGCRERHEEAGRDGIIELEEWTLGFEVAGRVAQVNVDRGEAVKAGQVLARLDDSLERAQRPIRQADLAGAEARLELLEAGPRATDIRALRAQLAAAQSQLDAAERDLKREQELFGRGATTRAQLDARLTQVSVARAQRDAVRQNLQTLEVGSRVQEIRAAAAARDAAQAALAAVDERLEHYVLTAPADGQVEDVTALAGEVVTPGASVVIFTQPERPYVDLFVPVPELAAIRVGQNASIHPDGDSASYPGVVEYISPTTEYTPHYLLSEKERQNLVTRVRVRIDDARRGLHAGVPCRVVLTGEIATQAPATRTNAQVPAGGTDADAPAGGKVGRAPEGTAEAAAPAGGADGHPPAGGDSTGGTQ